PYYRVVVADSRTKRDGRSIETIGKYHPKEDPSFIEIDGERAAYWLGVGAQPTEAVTALLKVTGDWQKFKGLPAPPPMLVKADKADKKTVFEAAAKGGAEAEAAEAEKPAKKAKTPKADKADAAAETTDAPAAEAAEAAEAPAAEATDAPATETTETTEATEAPAAEATEAPATAAGAPAEAAVDTAAPEAE
ncbi:MAG TPA: 30S ribosomal protein S16, partial [Mycobacteriales bacterium]|nr:30S ribosomal protein S16 [Mycobacteriales bacterium]